MNRLCCKYRSCIAIFRYSSCPLHVSWTDADPRKEPLLLSQELDGLHMLVPQIDSRMTSIYPNRRPMPLGKCRLVHLDLNGDYSYFLAKPHKGRNIPYGLNLVRNYELAMPTPTAFQRLNLNNDIV